MRFNLKCFQKKAANEMSEYLKSKSILLSNKPEEITGFSSMVFLDELRIFCPVVHQLVLSTCGAEESDIKTKRIAANNVASASATMSRLQNPKVLTFHIIGQLAWGCWNTS